MNVWLSIEQKWARPCRVITFVCDTGYENLISSIQEIAKLKMLGCRLKTAPNMMK
jgi:hypothetical protein